MIRVSVHLISAVSGAVSELARMDICNDGVTTLANARRGSYLGHTYRGRNAAALDRGGVSKRGEVLNWPREALHVWNLVAAMLGAMGYDKSAPKVELKGADVAQREPVLAGYRRAVGMRGGTPTWEYSAVGGMPLDGWEPVYTFEPAGWDDA